MDLIRERPRRPRGAPRRRAFDVTPTARPWLERGPDQCAWPVGEPDIPMRQLSCCAPTDGRTYCARHLRLATRPSEVSPAAIQALLDWLKRRRA